MLDLIQISSYENIMPKRQQEFCQISELTALTGERASYQLAYRTDEDGFFTLEIESEIRDHIKVYKTGCVPVMRTIHKYNTYFMDGNYISMEPGMFPDVLYEYTGEQLLGQFFYDGFWIEIDEFVPAGQYEIKATIRQPLPEYETTITLVFKVIDLKLPEPTLNYYNIIHLDCIASYYNVDVFSEKHWELFEKFAKMSADYGNNCTLMPIFTPPLDTYVGGERPTVQLVDVTKDGDKYTFGFEKLDRFIATAKRAGIHKFTCSQLVTQWGAKFTPKIMVTENGEYKRIFGWDVESTDERYLNFLHQLLPSLVEYFKAKGMQEDVVFTISDEPSDDETIARYAIISGVMKKYIEGFEVMDAMFDYEHFKNSGSTIPLTSIMKVDNFKDKCDKFYLYYCCAEDCTLSNRFIHMPLYRTRSIGYQLYASGATGFHHWAFNFYFSRESYGLIDPFSNTDAGGGFPAGDAFCVYPGKEGPLKSIRLIAFFEALQDIRALQLLESLIGRAETIKLIESQLGGSDFKTCATCAHQMIVFRNKINETLEKHVKK